MKYVLQIVVMLLLCAGYTALAGHYGLPWFVDLVAGFGLGLLSICIVEALG